MGRSVTAHGSHRNPIPADVAFREDADPSPA